MGGGTMTKNSSLNVIALSIVFAFVGAIVVGLL